MFPFANIFYGLFPRWIEGFRKRSLRLARLESNPTQWSHKLLCKFSCISNLLSCISTIIGPIYVQSYSIQILEELQKTSVVLKQLLSSFELPELFLLSRFVDWLTTGLQGSSAILKPTTHDVMVQCSKPKFFFFFQPPKHCFRQTGQR